MTKPPIPAANTLGKFQFVWVFGNMPEAVRQQVVEFWMRENAIANAAEAWRRSFEIACVLHDTESGAIAGACTVAIRLDEQGASYGFVRLFISPANRLLGLNRRLIKMVIAGFEAMAHQPGAPCRLIATIENRKFERPAAQRGLASLGFMHVGTAPNGEITIQRLLTNAD